jgi:hypothetical protein
VRNKTFIAEVCYHLELLWGSLLSDKVPVSEDDKKRIRDICELIMDEMKKGE